jgi:hypothetical protein
MTDVEIPRADEQMSRELFGTIFELSAQQPWLLRRSKELYDTIVLCENEDQKNLLVNLISRFHFRSAQSHLDDLRGLASKIAIDWNCSPEDTTLVALENGECADSSGMLVQQMKGPLAEHGSWKTGNFISRIGDVVDRAKDGSNIVFVDDFCGSGTSISKKVTWLNNKLSEVGKSASIRVAVGTSMEQSRDLITPMVVDFYSVHWLGKGLNGHFKEQELIDAIANMEAIEDKLSDRHGAKRIKNFSFGWGRSEALFYLEGGNPPNNNFPIFWWPKLKPDRNRLTILPRV